MSLEDIIRDKTPEDNQPEMGAEGLTMARYGWKYLLAHEPWVSLHLLSGADDQRQRAVLIESMMEEVIDGDVTGFSISSGEREEVEEKLSEVRERYL